MLYKVYKYLILHTWHSIHSPIHSLSSKQHKDTLNLAQVFTNIKYTTKLMEASFQVTANNVLCPLHTA